MRDLLITVACLVPAAAPAAQVYVVDVNNGPGAQYTDLLTACNAVPDGATLDVRPGNYGTFYINGKSLRVLAQPGATALVPLHGSCGIAGIPANKSVVIRGLGIASANITPALVRFGISNCQGSVLLDGVQGLSVQQLQVTATNCASLSIKGMQSGSFCQVNLSSCNTVVESSTIAGGFVILDAPGILCTQGTLQVVDSVVSGMTTYTQPTRFGIEMVQADVRLLGTTSVSSGFSWVNPLTFAIGGTGTVRSEPTVTFPYASAPYAATLQAVQQPMPALRTSLSSGQATATLQSPIGHLGLLVLGLPGPVTRLPGLADPLWIDPATFGNLVIGTIVAGAPVTTTVAIPPMTMRGTRAAWQAITWDLGTSFQLSNPSFVVLP